MASYSSKPKKFEAVGNGSYLYRYNIKEVTVQTGEKETDKRNEFQCDEATVWEPISSNKITEAVISSRWDPNYEKKLVNEFNSVTFGILTGDASKKVIDTYKAFLKERAEIKKQIDADCAELGIE